MTKNQLRKELVDLWNKDVGQVHESNGKNRGPIVDRINAEIGVGATSAQPYCIAGLLIRGVKEICERYGFKNPVYMTASTQSFWKHMKQFQKKTGLPGDIGIMQSRSDEDKGHAWGVVKAKSNHDYESVEYNTDGSGGRDGDGCYNRDRDDDGDSAKRFLGFVDVVEAIALANPGLFGTVTESSPNVPPVVTSDEPTEASTMTGKTLRKGAKGEAVKYLQNLLKGHGFRSIKVDGDFGSKTENTVNSFQVSRNLEVDGVVGPKTWAALGKLQPVTDVNPAGTTEIIEKRPFAWTGKHADADVWTDVALKAVAASKLPDLAVAGTEQFKRGYAQLSRERKVIFWAQLISIMARPESNFKPEEKYVEKTIFDRNGDNVVSRGLLQISIESANSYGCNLKEADQLHDPKTNIECAVKIITQNVSKHGQISGKVGEKWKGVSAYWSCMRNLKNGSPRASFNEIVSYMNTASI